MYCFFGRSFVLKDNEILSISPDTPSYLESVIRFHLTQDEFDAAVSAQPSKQIEFGIVISHAHAVMYGHFLIEVAPKVAAVADMYKAGIKIPIILAYNENKYVAEFIKIAIPDAIIIVPEKDDIINIKHCVIPSSYESYLYPEKTLSFFDEIADRCRLAASSDAFPTKLLLSRANVTPSFRVLENRSQVYDVAIECGCSIFECQNMSMVDQVAAFSRSSLIFGEYGSALHNAIFSGAEAYTVSMNCINNVQQAISASRNQNISLVMPDDGVPVIAPSPGVELYDGMGTYRVSPELVRIAINLYD